MSGAERDYDILLCVGVNAGVRHPSRHHRRGARQQLVPQVFAPAATSRLSIIFDVIAMLRPLGAPIERKEPDLTRQLRRGVAAWERSRMSLGCGDVHTP